MTFARFVMGAAGPARPPFSGALPPDPQDISDQKKGGTPCW